MHRIIAVGELVVEGRPCGGGECLITELLFVLQLGKRHGVDTYSDLPTIMICAISCPILMIYRGRLS